MSIKELKLRMNVLRQHLEQKINSANEGWSDSPDDVLARRQAVCDPHTGFEYFVNHYFPHYTRSPHKSELHLFLFEHLPLIAQSPESKRIAVAAPRGEAKSTICTQLYTLWTLLTDKKYYAIIAMDTKEQAFGMLEAIKAEIEFNARLAIDFPEMKPGKVWRAGAIMTSKGQKVEAVGAGQKLRGRRHGAYRPDLVVLDDIENDEMVKSPEQRDKLRDWVLKAVLKLGAPGEKLDIVYIGTILHYDSVLNNILDAKGWRTARFKAISRFPDNMALWDEWETIYLSEKGDDDTQSDAFYFAHQVEMDKGAYVSWLARPLLALMKIRAKDGHSAFDSEFQNDPVSGDEAIFNNAIHYWSTLPEGLIYFGAVDPSMGKSGASRDPSAILVGGYHRPTGKLYVVEAQIKKRLPDLIIEDVIRFHQKYDCNRWFVEIVQYQEFLKDELVKRSSMRGNPVPAIGVRPNSDKLLRIESLQPHMLNGLILFNQSQSTLLNQLRHFPKADHDDGPDALEMLWRFAVSSCTPIEWTPLNGDEFETRSHWR